MSMYPIASVLGDGSVSPSFTNIPQTFNHLQFRISVRDVSAVNESGLSIAFNAVYTAGNYIQHSIFGSGSTAGTNNSTTSGAFNPSVPGSTGLANSYGVIIIDILDYSSTNKLKVLKSIGGFDFNGTGRSYLHSCLFLSTSEINRIDVFGYGGAPVSGSRFDLYGIRRDSI